MVTKHRIYIELGGACLILAKIHMVTKLSRHRTDLQECLILAKIHMVTKLRSVKSSLALRLILAKIHMVTKHPW